MIDFNKSEFLTTYSGASSSPLRWFVDQVDKEFYLYQAGMYAIEKTRGLCIYCGTSLYEIKENIPVFSSIQWDHLQPASRWGLKTLGNFIPLCISCNNEKSDKKPVDYYIERRDGKKTNLFKTVKDFEDFVYDFQKPYREKFPEFYKLTIDYNDDMDDNEIFNEFFNKKDADGNWLVLIKKNSKKSKFSTNIANRDFWIKVYEASPDNRNGSTITAVRGKLGYIQEKFSAKFGDKSVLDLSTRDFINYCYSCLYPTRLNESSSSFGFTKNALTDFAKASGRQDFQQVIQELPGLATFKKIYDDSAKK